MGGGDAERHREGGGDERREAGEQHMLPEQREDFCAMLEPEADHAHGVTGPCRAGGRRAAPR